MIDFNPKEKDPCVTKVSWKCASELEKLLPRVRVIPANGSIDRYGFTYILADICGLSRPKRPFAEWVHGWIWDEKPTSESLAVNKLNRSVPVVVRNKTEHKALTDAGFREVVVGGLPFCYVGQQHESRNKHSLLAFPPHSAEVERLTDDQKEYLDFLASLKNDFDGIYVSIFHLDWGGKLCEAVKVRGLNVILGARPDDANSIIRIRSLLDAFDCVTTNNMGSHFVYALHANCKFSLSGPLFQYDEEIFFGNGNPHNHSLAKVKRLMEIQSESYLRSRFNRFFVDHPSDGTRDVPLGSSEIGFENTLDQNQIREAIGWTVSKQIRGYSRGCANRIVRFIERQND